MLLFVSVFIDNEVPIDYAECPVEIGSPCIMTVESWNTFTFFNINWTGIFYIDIFICEGIESL